MEKCESYIEKLKNASDISKFSFKDIQVWAKCVKVYDGDTVHLIFETSITPLRLFSCRLLGCNSAEIKSKDKTEKELAHKAKDYLSDLILGKILWIKLDNFDKYGRCLVDIYLDDKTTHIKQINVR